ncbi:MAG: ArsR family transcriptional regulator [Thermoproteota archaeon]|nr:ArsR family transcriptional regulator [Thermoproteota archaeon]
MLRDGRYRDFNQLMREVDFSHNTLRLHLNCLVDQGLVVKKKKPLKGLGRPRFMYSVPPKLHRQASRLFSDPFSEVVTLPFRKLRHLCRFEKGGYCKKIKNRCTPQNCPQILKKE